MQMTSEVCITGGSAAILQLIHNKLQACIRLSIEEAFNTCHITCRLIYKTFLPVHNHLLEIWLYWEKNVVFYG